MNYCKKKSDPNQAGLKINFTLLTFLNYADQKSKPLT